MSAASAVVDVRTPAAFALARLTPEGQTLFEHHFPKATAFVSALMDERLSTAEQTKRGELLEKLDR